MASMIIVLSVAFLPVVGELLHWLTEWRFRTFFHDELAGDVKSP